MPMLHSGLMGDAATYQITNSVRLRAAASAYFSRTTPASGGDRDKWWLYVPFKRGSLTTDQQLHGAGAATPDSIYFNLTTDTLTVSIGGSVRLISSRVFRDPSAWGAFLVVYDASNATAAQRLRVYERSEGNATFAEITSWGTDNRSGITAGTAMTMHNSTLHTIGRYSPSAANYFDGYLAQHAIGTWSGTAPTPASFGSVNTDGIWVDSGAFPSVGTSGSILNFKDAALTAGSNVGLGKDVSGNVNYWTTNNISVTAGVTYDSTTDSPTCNFATLNPISNDSTDTLSYAALRYSIAANQAGYPTSTIAVSSGKWWWEVTVSSTHNTIGILPVTASPTANLFTASGGYGYYGESGTKYVNGSSSAYGSNTTFTTGDVIGIALDLDSGTNTITFYKQTGGSGSFVVNAGGAITVSSGGTWKIGGANGNSLAAASGDYNFLQRPSSNAASIPTGFKALCTANRTGTITTSGTFTGNANADGPFVWIGGVTTVLTINGNAVTFGTHADKTAGGFKLRTASASYNASGSNTWTATATMNFGTTSLSPAPAQGNP